MASGDSDDQIREIRNASDLSVATKSGFWAIFWLKGRRSFSIRFLSLKATSEMIGWLAILNNFARYVEAKRRV
ncbi:MAG TPA: hypothetical protein VG966_09905 [Hyphomicrobiaceae bacterium]|nr:hypothetical protein [Hyphomicrobiaceae bacterium]